MTGHEIVVGDAARPVGSWGIFRVRAVDGDRLGLDAGAGIEWFDRADVEYLRTPERWAEEYFA